MNTGAIQEDVAARPSGAYVLITSSEGPIHEEIDHERPGQHLQQEA